MSSDSLEEKTKRYYEFDFPRDFSPITGMFRYNRRSLNGYLDECKAAKKRFVPAFWHTAPRRLLILTYNFFIVWGGLEAASWLYDKL